MAAIKVGFIGLGGIATRAHIPALQTMSEEVVIQAGSELNSKQAERTQKRFNIPRVYDSYKTMLDEEQLEAVYVCLPNFLHHDAVMAALEKGLNVYCEKPMGISSDEAKRLTDKADSRKLVLVPGYNLRFESHFARARQIVKERRLGKILQVQAVAAKPGPYIGWDPKSEWYFDRRNVGVLYDQGGHLLDLMLYVTGVDVEQVNVTSDISLPGLSVPDSIVAAFTSRHGAIGSINLSWGCPGNLTMLLIHGTAGSVIVSDGYFEYRTPQHGGIDRLMVLYDNAREVLRQTFNSVVKRQSSNTTYVDASRDFLQAIRSGEKPSHLSADDGVLVHKGLEAIRDAILQSDQVERA